MSEPHVRAEGLRLSYQSDAGNIPILQGLDFEIKKGEMVAIQGPSGSGKSTLLYLLGGLLRPTSGEVSIEGKILGKQNPEELAHFRNQRIGFVFQQFFLLPRYDVIENILLPRQYGPPSDADQNLQTAQHLATLVGLSDRMDHQPNQLSGGQQQRVAIARALVNGAPLLLADEPTGNLDSKTAREILGVFRELNSQGQTVVLITHDDSVAKSCDRVLHLRDGRLIKDEVLRETKAPHLLAPSPVQRSKKQSLWLKVILSISATTDAMRKNLARSLLTMMGVTVGVAAVLSMLTIGRFTKEHILRSYAELGVYTMMFNGYENWRLTATDKVTVMFKGFDDEKDLKPLLRIFPAIQAYSPSLDTWVSEVSYGGQTVKEQINITGVSHWAGPITGRGVTAGKTLSPYHVENRSPVCMIGSELASRLFRQTNPLGQVITGDMGNGDSMNCRVIGILEDRTTNSQWRKPNFDITLPYTYLQSTISSYWRKNISGFLVQVSPGTDLEKFGLALQAYFESKYGKSGIFSANSDTNLISQMQRFLTLFTWLLGSIALVTLTVGGMGITNMMLVSVSERYKEIGLKKAVGATDNDIRLQFLIESLFICTGAGFLGLILGFGFYEGALWMASKFSQNITFVWWWDPWAFAIALMSIFVVGITAGLFPAIKAERLQVIEALRSE